MKNLYDVIIIGGGPAGLSAAIYLARAKYSVLVMEKERFGGQITITSEIVNYPGIEKTDGKALTEAMRFQAEDFGAEFVLAEVKEMELDSPVKTIKTAKGKEYQAIGVVLALGASPRKVGFEGEQEFQGRGVAYCATCDGEFFTGREVLVVGGGFAAVEEAMFLTKYASKVTILVRGDSFSCAAGVVEKLSDYPSIKVRYNTELVQVSGEGVLTGAVLKNNISGETEEYRAEDGGAIGVFVFAGYEPATVWLKGQILLNEQGYIVTDQEQKTSREGVYAAGDVCIKKLRQVVTAVADGAIAATSLEKYVSETREAHNLPITRQEKQTREQERLQQREHKQEGENQEGGFISEDMKAQLIPVFDRFSQTVTVEAVLGTDNAAPELEGFVQELNGMHDKVKTEIRKETGQEQSYIHIIRESGDSGIRYYSVPGGHEFNSFVIALYNVAGPGQQISDMDKERIQGLVKPHKLQVMTTLSCTNCPEVVMGTQKIASLSDKVQAEMYDIAKFPDIKDKYRIMAVPCLVIDDEKVYFGKRNMEEIVGLLEEVE